MRGAGVVAMTALLLLVGGCNVAGAVQYAAMGPPATPAMYKLNKVPTLVLVENYEAPSAAALDSDRLAMLLSRELQTHRVAPVVDPAALAALREQKPRDFGSMRISEIGQAVGAEQVIYINLIRSDVEQTAGLLKATLSARVKVIDAKTGRLLWPQDSAEGYPVGHETPMIRPEETVTAETVRAKMIDTIALKIGRMFYNWKPEYAGQI